MTMKNEEDAMRRDLRRTFLMPAMLALLAFVAAPLFGATAFAADAQLYELTENMKLISKGQPRRVATSELMGFAAKGSPLCPTSLLEQLGAKHLIDPATFPQCTINATGSNDVSLVTGVGPLSGRFTVVVQGDNAVDAPELVVMRGKFRGTIDFGNVRTFGFGTATGTFTSDAGHKIPFSGTFRVPYVIFLDFSKNPPTPCNPTTGNPSCVQVTPPVYTDLEGGNALGVEVAPNEYAIGYPTVRFDINF